MIIWLIIFAVAMAFAEAAVVVYLRAIYYPEGFHFPLKAFNDYKIFIEVFREIATLVMLSTVAHIAGKNFRERFANLLLTFGVWDIFYYVWLKTLIGWPASVFDPDILFLIPIPWIGPVIAPVSISLLMIIFSILITRSARKGHDIKPAVISYVLAAAGTAIVLYSFMHNTSAALHQEVPEPYRYGLLIAGDGLFAAAFLVSYLKSVKLKGLL